MRRHRERERKEEAERKKEKRGHRVRTQSWIDGQRSEARN